MLEKTRVQLDEYLALPETNTPMELLDGEVIVSPAPVPKHQDVSQDFVFVLRDLTKPLGGHLYFAPIDVVLSEDVVQPDILWLAPDTQCLVTDKNLVGAPDLIVEILSPGSIRRDRVTKRKLYQRFGVREYWIVEPAGVVDVLTLRDGVYALLDTYGDNETFASPLLGMTVDLSACFTH